MAIGSTDAVLGEIGIEQFRQVLGAWPTLNFYAKYDVGIAEYNITGFSDKGTAIKLLNGRLCLQLVIESNQKLPSCRFRNMTVLSSFQAIIFLHPISLISALVTCKDPGFAQERTTGTFSGLGVQLVCKASQMLFKGPACAVCPMLLCNICGARVSSLLRSTVRSS